MKRINEVSPWRPLPWRALIAIQNNATMLSMMLSDVTSPVKDIDEFTVLADSMIDTIKRSVRELETYLRLDTPQ